jgi:DNA-binding protein HU-beta
MNKRDVVDAVAARLGRPKTEMAPAVDAVFAVITEALEHGEKVAISGFGNFEARRVAERTARNPRTGQPVVVPAHLAPKFKASRNLKEALGH